MRQTVGCFLMANEIWKVKQCYQQVTDRLSSDGVFYKVKRCGKPPTHIVRMCDYYYYLCDEHKNNSSHSVPIREESQVFSKRLRWLVMERDGHKCVKCGRSAADGVKLEVDHSYPKIRGGMATMENGQTLCFDCNRGKAARVPQTHPTPLALDGATRAEN